MSALCWAQASAGKARLKNTAARSFQTAEAGVRRAFHEQLENGLLKLAQRGHAAAGIRSPLLFAGSLSRPLQGRGHFAGQVIRGQLPCTGAVMRVPANGGPDPRPIITTYSYSYSRESATPDSAPAWRLERDTD